MRLANFLGLEVLLFSRFGVDDLMEAGEDVASGDVLELLAGLHQ